MKYMKYMKYVQYHPCPDLRFNARRHAASAVDKRPAARRSLLCNTIGFAFRSFKSFKCPGDSLNSSSSSTPTHGVHIFQCPDAIGIVTKLSDCIASRGGNIFSADVFIPKNKHVFHSRSFQDHCLVDLLHRWQDGRLPVDITCVISNHGRGANTHVIRFLKRHGIPYHYIRTTIQNKREGEILELVQKTQFLVLARFMQMLSGNFLKSYGKDIINIHQGLLPSFKGGNPSKQAFDAGVKLIGATSHFVTEELDAGPIIEHMVIARLFAAILPPIVTIF